MVRRIGIKLAALAQDGLTYGADEYDLDRYRQMSRLAAELLSVVSGQPADELALELGRDVGYATPKIEVRGAIFDDDERVLLMREKIDGRWSLPGGWADPGDAPSVAVTREILEETGYHSSAVKLIAWANATAMAAGQVAFVAPLAASRVPAHGSGLEISAASTAPSSRPTQSAPTSYATRQQGTPIRPHEKHRCEPAG